MRRVCAVVAVVLLAATGCSDKPAPATAPPPTPSPTASVPPAPDGLPRGGRVLFPKYQLVAYVGLPGSPALGPLDKDLDAKTAKLETLARAYAAGRTPQTAQRLPEKASVFHQLPTAVHAGFKLFYTEDTRHGLLMTPAQVLALKPRPEPVVYE